MTGRDDRVHRPIDRTDPAPTTRRPRIAFYAMYDPSVPDRAPRVRIRMLDTALRRQADVVMISGERLARGRRGLSWVLRGGLRSIDAVYVESSTSFSTPVDLAILAAARASGKPVGVYFRDAHQLFRHDFPIPGGKARALDALWRISTPVLRQLATHQYVQSVGMAEVLRLSRPTLLPPGTDPSFPFVGAGDDAVVAALISPTKAGELQLLLDAMVILRVTHPDHRLLLIGPLDEALRAALPAWVDVATSNRTDLPGLLAPAQLVVIPLPGIRYMNMVIPVRLMDYLALGKPVVSTALEETRRALGESQAIEFADATPSGLATGIAHVIDDPALRSAMAVRARRVAESPAWTWDARATTILRTLLPCRHSAPGTYTPDGPAGTEEAH